MGKVVLHTWRQSNGTCRVGGWTEVATVNVLDAMKSAPRWKAAERAMMLQYLRALEAQVATEAQRREVGERNRPTPDIAIPRQRGRQSRSRDQSLATNSSEPLSQST